MRFRLAGNSENIEPQNIEGWFHYALSFEPIKIDRIPYFVIHGIGVSG